jgi:hypothetical protein
MAPLCGKVLSPEDQKVWQQALAMLMGLKIRNGFERGSVGRRPRVFLTRPEHLLTPFHAILIVEFGGHLPTLPSF